MAAADRDESLISEREAGAILPRVLTSFDLVAMLVAIVLFITNAAVIQPAGPSAFGWWIIAFAVFLVPCAMVTGQLGVLFPGEGSIYLWTHKALGPLWGFLAGFCAWWPGVLVMVATGTSAVAFAGYAFPAAGAWSVQVQGLVVVGVIVASALIALLRLRVTQDIVNVVLVVYGLAIAAMFAAGVVYLARGHHAAVNPWHFPAWRPGAARGLGVANWSFFGLAVLALLGIEVPLNMGAEIRSRRSVTRYLAWGSLVIVVAYLLATWGVMVTVPPGAAAGITSVAAAVGIGLGGLAGRATATALALFFVFATVVCNYSFARLIFVSGLDRRLPARLSHVNRARVPDTAVWVQTVIAVAVTLAAFVLVPAITGGPAARAQTRIYDVVQAAVAVLWCISVLVLFADVLVIVRRYRGEFARRRLAHPVVLWACSIVGSLAALVAIVSTLSGSWTTLIGNDAGELRIGGAVIRYGDWSWWVGGITLGSLVVAVLLYAAGGRGAAAGRGGSARPAPTRTAGGGARGRRRRPPGRHRPGR